MVLFKIRETEKRKRKEKKISRRVCFRLEGKRVKGITKTRKEMSHGGNFAPTDENKEALKKVKAS